MGKMPKLNFITILIVFVFYFFKDLVGHNMNAHYCNFEET